MMNDNHIKHLLEIPGKRGRPHEVGIGGGGREQPLPVDAAGIGSVEHVEDLADSFDDVYRQRRSVILDCRDLNARTNRHDRADRHAVPAIGAGRTVFRRREGIGRVEDTVHATADHDDTAAVGQRRQRRTIRSRSPVLDAHRVTKRRYGSAARRRRAGDIAAERLAGDVLGDR